MKNEIKVLVEPVLDELVLGDASKLYESGG
jgi:hypothetical protein